MLSFCYQFYQIMFQIWIGIQKINFLIGDYIFMKLNTIVFLAILASAALALPWEHQIALVNSLEVGRNEEPTVWQCFGCDDENRPLSTFIIQEPVKDVKAILSVYEEYTVLAFRYTATIKNVFQDILWAIQTQDEHACQGCKVQKAMDGMWNSIRSYTLEGLRKHSHTGRLIITGISLGGALTCLSYVDIAHEGIFDNIELITFGAPRIGNKKWANWFDEQTQMTRYFIKNDPIASLPICLTLICNYKQAGTPIVCNKNYQECRAKNPKEYEGEQFSLQEFADAVISGAQQHFEHEYDEGESVGGIIDHITGYKKIRDFTLVE